MILVTGGAGFIGINFCKKLFLEQRDDVVVVDKLCYPSTNNYNYLKELSYPFHIMDIADRLSIEHLFKIYPIKTIVNFAAETHVDNSIKDCNPFIHSNVTGTVNLLQHAVRHGVEKFIQISTDEVFGEIVTGSFDEASPIKPRNPYSASKAAAEHFVEAFHNTYELPYNIINCSNNYGPYQHQEKFIPTIITSLMSGKKVPVYGTGMNMRNWIYVSDAVRAIYSVLERGSINQRYCIGGDNTVDNLTIVKRLIRIMNKSESRIAFVDDRRGHDYRYSVNSTKIRKELGWSPVVSLDQGLKSTVEWYCENRVQLQLF